MIRFAALGDCQFFLGCPGIKPWPLDPLWMAVPVECLLSSLLEFLLMMGRKNSERHEKCLGAIRTADKGTGQSWQLT